MKHDLALLIALLLTPLGALHAAGNLSERPKQAQTEAADISATGAAGDPTTSFEREQERWRDVRGFNYQPSFGRTAVEIWIDKFDAAAVDRELGLGRKYFPQINTVRLWLSHDPFLKDPALFTRNFEAVLQSCQKHRLRAIPTLFNDWHSIPDFGGVSREMIGYWFRSYGRKGQASDYVFRPFLEAMFKAHAKDARILAWDLCNEPFNNGGEVYLEWLRHTYQTAKTLGATQPLGVSVAASLEQVKQVEPFSDVLMIHPYFASKVPWEPLTAFAREHGKALLATECCWGALNDASRTAIIQSDCGTLAQQKVGFLAHALHESLVSDLHRPQFSPLRVASSASYMAFINMDGALRPGHDVFNRYCQGLSPTGSNARTEVDRDKAGAAPPQRKPARPSRRWRLPKWRLLGNAAAMADGDADAGRPGARSGGVLRRGRGFSEAQGHQRMGQRQRAKEARGARLLRQRRHAAGGREAVARLSGGERQSIFARLGEATRCS